MQYGQIVFLLFIALLFYYAALIVLDIMKAKAAQAAELESQSEEDIDISDEAKTFKPFRISREEPKQKEHGPEEQANSDSETKSNRKQPQSNFGKPFHRTGFREAIMKDGILVEDLVVEVNKMVENGTCDLGSLIADCENAK